MPGDTTTPGTTKVTMARNKRKKAPTRRDEVATRSVPHRAYSQPYRALKPVTVYQAPAPKRGPLVTRPASYSSTAAARPRAAARAKLAKLYQLRPELLVCAKRHIRKQVIHALGKAGQAGQRRPRYNANSKVKCP